MKKASGERDEVQVVGGGQISVDISEISRYPDVPTTIVRVDSVESLKSVTID